MDPGKRFFEEKHVHSKLQFSSKSLRHLFVFKSKSEQESFSKLVHKIYSLHTQTKDEVIYTYQRVFKFLLENLSRLDFDQLSFFNVNKMIDMIFYTKIQPHSNTFKVTVKEFLAKVLELPYLQSQSSAKALDDNFNLNHYHTKSLWHSCKGISID